MPQGEGHIDLQKKICSHMPGMQYSGQRKIGAPSGETGRFVDPKRSRLRMVREQLENRGITDAGVLDVMARVPRHLFVQEALRAQAYEDTSLPIGYGQTISQPYIVALMSQYLEVQKGARVLEIGTGSGYQAAVLAGMGCTVFTVERVRELHQNAVHLFRQMGLNGIHPERRDGTLGMPEAAPFDRIIVTAGGPEVPSPLVDQLDEGGILLIPVGDKRRVQRLVRVRKENGRTLREELDSVVFVDLVGNHGW